MVRLVAFLLLALCLTPVLVLAQSDTATVSGLVTDSKGAVLVGAQVRAVNVEAGTRSTAFTNRNGVYVLHDLRPGQYRLIVDNQGFQQIVLVGLVLARRMRWAVTSPCRSGRSSSPSPLPRPARR